MSDVPAGPSIAILNLRHPFRGDKRGGLDRRQPRLAQQVNQSHLDVRLDYSARFVLQPIPWAHLHDTHTFRIRPRDLQRPSRSIPCTDHEARTAWIIRDDSRTRAACHWHSAQRTRAHAQRTVAAPAANAAPHCLIASGRVLQRARPPRSRPHPVLSTQYRLWNAAARRRPPFQYNTIIHFRLQQSQPGTYRVHKRTPPPPTSHSRRRPTTDGVSVAVPARNPAPSHANTHAHEAVARGHPLAMTVRVAAVVLLVGAASALCSKYGTCHDCTSAQTGKPGGSTPALALCERWQGACGVQGRKHARC